MGEDSVLLERILGSSSREFLEKTCSIFMKVVDSYSREGELLIYLFGLKLGERIGREIDMGDHWRILSDVLRGMGLVESVDMIAESFRGTTLRVRFSGDRERGKIVFMKGLIAGLISQVSGKYFLIIESDCHADTCLLRLTELPEDPELDPPRSLIMEYLRFNPGAHLRQMARDLGMSLGSLRWHLSVLERKGLVREKRKGNLTEFYPSEVLEYHQISSSQGTS